MSRPIVIVGCTASGKSDLAEALAERLGGAILAVDSMQVYRGMDIGTAKPDAATRARIPHYMIDVADPWESYSAARFVGAARGLLEKPPRPLVLVGGTIFYLRALLEGMFEGPGADEGIRAALEAAAAERGTAALHARLQAVDPLAASRIHPNDLRRIVRALEVYQLTGTPISTLQTQWSREHPQVDALLIGIQRDKETLNRRINARVKQMLEAGLVEEVRRLHSDPRGFSEEARSGVGYQQIIAHFANRLSLEQAVEEVKIQTRHLAKMQRTWLKRFRNVVWLEAAGDQPGSALLEQALALVEN